MQMKTTALIGLLLIWSVAMYLAGGTNQAAQNYALEIENDLLRKQNARLAKDRDDKKKLAKFYERQTEANGNKKNMASGNREAGR